MKVDPLGEDRNPCSCCGLPRIQRRERHADDRRAENCGPCTQHAGSNLQMQSEHRRWWIEHRELLLTEIRDERARTSRMEDVAAGHARALDAMREGTIVDIDTNPDHPLHVYLERAAVLEATSKVTAAYRSRDRALRTIWHLEERHHESTTRGTCSCGTPTRACREHQMLRPVLELLQRWEREQEARMLRGDPHGLPADHPHRPSRADGLSWSGAPSLRDELASLDDIERRLRA